MVSVLRPQSNEGSADDGCIYVSGTGFAGGRHGQGPRGGLSGRAGGVRRGRFGARREADRHHLGRPGRNPATHRKRPAGPDGGVDRHAAGAGNRGGLFRGDGMRPSSPAIRSANIPRWPPPAASASAIPRACCAPAVLQCRKPSRSASARWPRCSGSTTRRRWRSPAKPRRVRSARPPTTMAAGRSSCPATRPPSIARSKSPRPRAPSARCCCRCPRRSIAS